MPIMGQHMNRVYVGDTLVWEKRKKKNVIVPPDNPDFTPINRGAFYNYYAVEDVRKLFSSDDWEIASETKFNVVINSLGGKYLAGYHLKIDGDIWWPPGEADNSVHFNAKSCGWRDDLGYFAPGQVFKIWTSTAYGSYQKALYIEEGSSLADFSLFNSKNRGMSLRPSKIATSLSDGEHGIYIGNDGKIYRTICIAGIEFLDENLFETKFRNGEMIPVITSNSEWEAMLTSAMCYWNNNILNA